MKKRIKKQTRNPSFKEEKILWSRGLNQIVGLDEVGRGAFAGPLVAASVILPKNFKINGIRDSKLLTSEKRQALSKYIKENATYYSISEVNLSYINRYGVGKAVQKAFLDTVKKLPIKPNYILVDGYKVENLKYDIVTAHIST